MQKIAVTIAVSALIWSAISAFELDRHHDYEALKQVMQDVHRKCPNITRLYSLPDAELKGVKVPTKTTEGRELLVIEFSTEPGKHVETKPEFKYVANMHGNEVRGRELLLKLMDYMCDMWNGEGQAESRRFSREHIVWLLEHTRIHFLPSLNPDGYEAAANKDAENGKKDWLLGRANANGTDLNRNFPDLDMPEFRIRNIPGHPNNHLDVVEQVIKELGNELEPETQMMMAWIHSINFVLSSNFHEGDLVANYPYDETSDGSSHNFNPSPDQKTFLYLAKSYSLFHKIMSKKHKPCDMNGDFLKSQGTTNGAAWYSVPGGLQDYNYMSSNDFGTTMEQGCQKFPSANQLPGIWRDNIDSLINYMIQSHIGIKGRIISPEDMNLIATIKVTDEDSGTYIDHDILSSADGDYFRLLADGNYTIQAVVVRAVSPEEEVQVSRWACVEVRNNPTSPQAVPRRLQEALVVDFDFTDLNVIEDGKSCYMDYSSEEGQYPYTDILELLKDLEQPGQYRDNY